LARLKPAAADGIGLQLGNNTSSESFCLNLLLDLHCSNYQPSDSLASPQMKATAVVVSVFPSSGLCLPPTAGSSRRSGVQANLLAERILIERTGREAFKG